MPASTDSREYISVGDSPVRICSIAVSDKELCDRAGLSLFARYIEQIDVLSLVAGKLKSLRKSRKGITVPLLLKQVLCFFMDGSSFHLTRFEELANDSGYAGCIETRPEQMASCHQIKRFFGAFSFVHQFLLRQALQKLFLWRLKIEKPDRIFLDIDTMVMNNDDAHRREGVDVTYKKIKGFQPLQVIWNGYVIDAVFRRGSKHSNYSDTVAKAIIHLVKSIRTNYRDDVPIILTCDSGFFDDKNFLQWEGLGIGYVSSGKLYSDILDYVDNVPMELWTEYTNGNCRWELLEFGDRRGTWKQFRRAVYSRQRNQDSQLLMPFAGIHSVTYTNIGMGGRIDQLLRQKGCQHLFTIEGIIETGHSRGIAELTNRAVKDFGTEKMPFKRFESNAAFYYLMLIAFNLFQAFKTDIGHDVIPINAYATTVRRLVLDIAGQFVRKSRQITLKFAKGAWERLNIPLLWNRIDALSIPPLQ